MNTVCPHCGTRGKADASLAGREVSCPQCKKKFILAKEDSPSSEGIQQEPHPFEHTVREHDGVHSPSSEIIVFEILKDSWQLSKDRRFAVICRVGMVLIILAMYGITRIVDSESGLIIGLLGKLSLPEALLSFAGALLTLLSMGLSGNAKAGLPYLGIRHGAGERVGLQTCFRGFYPECFKQLFLVGIIETVLTLFGFLFLIFPGIYLTFAYWFALPLVLDRGLGAWQALELSRKTVTKVWFQVFGVYFTMGVLPFFIPAMLLTYSLTALFEKIGEQKLEGRSYIELYAVFPGDFHIIGILGLFIVVLWFFLLPWFFASYGVLYQKLFVAENNEKKEGRI